MAGVQSSCISFTSWVCGADEIYHLSRRYEAIIPRRRAAVKPPATRARSPGERLARERVRCALQGARFVTPSNSPLCASVARFALKGTRDARRSAKTPYRPSVALWRAFYACGASRPPRKEVGAAINNGSLSTLLRRVAPSGNTIIIADLACSVNPFLCFGIDFRQHGAFHAAKGACQVYPQYAYPANAQHVHIAHFLREAVDVRHGNVDVLGGAGGYL